MFINLSDVLTSEGKVLNMTVPLEMTKFSSRLGEFPVVAKQPVTFTFTNIGVNEAKVEGTLVLTLQTSCDRCLAEVPTTLTLDFDRVVAAPDMMSEDKADDQHFMEGYQLDVEAFVYHEILLNWPVKILCKEDCKGVCMKCGQNLNIEDCGCDTFVPDPRMAVIQDIFNANKEV